MCSWKLGHRAVRFIINAVSGLINYGCSHNSVDKGEAHCSLWCSCEGLYSPGCITTQAILTFTTAKWTQKSHHRQKWCDFDQRLYWWQWQSMPGHTHPLRSDLNEYSCLHKLCFTSANSRQTFSQNAHEVDQHPLSYCNTWQCMVSSAHSHHLPRSLNITICLIVPSKFPFPHPLPPSHYFCSTTPPSPLCSPSRGYWPTWQAWMILPVFVGPPYLNDLVES